MISWRSVFSSTVAAVGHDSDTNELLVEWLDGKISAYQGVDPLMVDDISKSYSVGKAIHAQIKGKFSHRYR
jgi:hypothetical protein